MCHFIRLSLTAAKCANVHSVRAECANTGLSTAECAIVVDLASVKCVNADLVNGKSASVE